MTKISFLRFKYEIKGNELSDVEHNYVMVICDHDCPISHRLVATFFFANLRMSVDPRDQTVVVARHFDVVLLYIKRSIFEININY